MTCAPVPEGFGCWPSVGWRPKRSVPKRAAAIEPGRKNRVDIRAAGLREEETPQGTGPSSALPVAREKQIHGTAARYAQRTSPPRARQKTETGRQVLTTSLHRATSSHYSRNDNVRNRTDIRWASQALKPAPGIERRGAAKREVILPSEGSAPAVRTEAIRSEEVSDCTTDCSSTMSVVQASPSQVGTDEAPQRRSWTPSETVPHGAVFGPEASTASVLVWSVSPVTPHAYCTSGAPALTSSARATRTRVFSNVWESSLIVGNIFV